MKTCKECGKEYLKKNSKFCSKECRSRGFIGFSFSDDVRKKMRAAKIGKSAGMLGKKHSEDTKKKISIKISEVMKGNKHNIGKKHSDEWKLIMSKKYSGENSATWAGGKTSENKRIRNGIQWRLWREAVFARDNWTCQECGNRGVEIQPHHIKQFAYFPELRFAIDNGVTLCKKCHLKPGRHKKHF